VLTSTPLQDPFPRGEPFDCVVRQGEHGEVILQLSGELDIASVGRLDKSLSDALNNAESVVVDLRQVSFMDGAGLGALVSAQTRALTRGRRLALVRATSQFDVLLEVTGLGALFETLDSRSVERPRSARDQNATHLECPRCGLMIQPRAEDPAVEHCPRCLGRSGLAIPMFLTVGQSH
jgi:anti-sigma B factor antagonist